MRPTASQFTNPSAIVDKRLGRHFEAVDYVSKNIDKIAHLSYYLESLFNLDRNLTLLSDENVDHHILKDITIFQGPSAYELSVKHGFIGTEEEWLESLRGLAGDPGPPGVLDQLALNGILDGIQSNANNIASANLLINQNASQFGQYVTNSELSQFSLDVDTLIMDVRSDNTDAINSVLSSIPSNAEITANALSVVNVALGPVNQAVSDADQRVDATNSLLDALRQDLDEGTTAFNNFLLQNDTTIIRLAALEAVSEDHSSSIIDLDFVTAELASRQVILQAQSITHNSNIDSLSQVTADSALQINVLQVANNSNNAAIVQLNTVTSNLVTTTDSLVLTVGSNHAYSLNTRTITANNAASINSLGIRTDNTEADIINLRTVSEDNIIQLDALTLRTDTAENSIVNLQSVTSTNAIQHNALAVRVGSAEGDIINLDTLKAGRDELSIEAARTSAIEARTSSAESGILLLESSKANQSSLEAEAARIAQINSRLSGSVPSGIQAGVQGSVIFVKNSTTGGDYNPGELVASAGVLEHPLGVKNVFSETITTAFEGSFELPNRSPFYVVWSQTDASTRFVGINTVQYFIAYFDDDTSGWRYMVSNSSTSHAFTPLESDRVVAVGYHTSEDPDIRDLNSLINFTDIQSTITNIQSTKADRTELFDVASAIQEDRIRAETAAAASLLSQTNSALSESNAAGSASTAITEAANSANSANTAGQHATAAANSSTQAASEASASSLSAAASQSASLVATTAQDQISIVRAYENSNPFFDFGEDYWTSTYIGLYRRPELIPITHNGNSSVVSTDRGSAIQTTGYMFRQSTRGVKYQLNRKYRIRTLSRCVQDSTNGHPNEARIGFSTYSGSWDYLALLGWNVVVPNLTVNDGWVESSAKFHCSPTPEAGFVGVGALDVGYFRPFFGIGGASSRRSNAVNHTAYCVLEDITGEDNADQAATAAATSASLAMASETASAQNANISQNHAINAGTSASQAGVHSANAASSATTATGAASQAGVAQNIAVNASNATIAAARALLPSTFEDDSLHFTSSFAGNPSTVADTGSQVNYTSVGGSRVANIIGYNWLLQKGVTEIKPNTVWEMTVILSKVAGDTPSRYYHLVYGLNDDYLSLSTSFVRAFSKYVGPADGEQALKFAFTSDQTLQQACRNRNIANGTSFSNREWVSDFQNSKYFRIGGLCNYDGRTADNISQMRSMSVKDITGEIVSGLNASASAQSATLAAASQTAAGASASAASNHALNAAASASSSSASAGQSVAASNDAASSATTALNHANSAAGSAGAAANTLVLVTASQVAAETAAATTASLAVGNSWCNNPAFAEWSSNNVRPDRWERYSNGLGGGVWNRETTITKFGDASRHITGSGGGSDLFGMFARTYNHLGMTPGTQPSRHVVFEAWVYLVSGSWNGSGMYLNYRYSPGQSYSVRTINFSTLGLPTGKWTLVSQYLDWGVDLPNGLNDIIVYAMTNYPFPGGRAAKDLIWGSMSVRAATDSEIQAQKVNAIEASVVTNTSAIASEAATRAALAQTVTANANTASINASAISTLQGVNNSTIVLRAQAGNSALLELVAQSTPGGSSTSARISASNILLSGSVTATHLSTNSVTADKINVGQLSAISADIGVMRTASSGQRLEIRNDKILVYDSSNVLRVKIGNLN